MDPIYRDIYTELYSTNVARASDQPELRDEVSGLIHAMDLASTSLQFPLAAVRPDLRPDARFLLFTLFINMIVLPLTVSGRLRHGELSEMVQGDVRTIVGDVIKRRRRTNSPQDISGHEILDSIARNWQKLSVTKFRLWGDE
ncbi:MAG: hypothetical protein HYX28_09505 [Candidatus Koribacter versatilis]|uniref:Uncharacterized protein n=1 Tax=Candidatus Korobacter versatilis TaxID=658062 RepID=A0A932EQ81_9BACT|nr:hypothetical protein [Candidatus Koribacter versatilis]